MLTAVAIVTGLIAWSGEPKLLPVAMAFPALWSLARSRLGAALVSAGYFLAASRGLPEGAATFFESGLALGTLLWLGACLPFVVTHALLWTARPGWHRPFRYLASAGLMTVPPLGILGWAHPVTAAGILIPASGWFGLMAVIAALLVMTTRLRLAMTAILAGLWLWSSASWTDPILPAGWIGVDTNFLSGREQFADLEQHRTTIAMVRNAAEQGPVVVVLPESALGIWTPSVERLWRRALADLHVTVIGGAVLFTAEGYENLMVAIDDGEATIAYRQRMPVPVSMWQPWRQGGAAADFFGNPVVEIAGHRTTVLLCYEQLLIWPILHSMALKPDVIMATGNAWWTGGTNILPIQRATTVAWARLFGLPTVVAFNA